MKSQDEDAVKSSIELEQTGVSRPLPLIRIERPSADRGAKRERDILDAPECIFCGAPTAEDERNIPADKFGMLVHENICKDHSEHPESWRRGRSADAKRQRKCPECGRITTMHFGRRICWDCDPEIDNSLDTWEDRCL